MLFNLQRQVIVVKIAILILVRSGILCKITVDKVVIPTIMIYLLNHQTRVHMLALLHNYLVKALQLRRAMNTETTNNQIITPKIVFRINLIEAINCLTTLQAYSSDIMWSHKHTGYQSHDLIRLCLEPGLQENKT